MTCLSCAGTGWQSTELLCSVCYSESIPEYFPEPVGSEEDEYWRKESGRGVF